MLLRGAVMAQAKQTENAMENTHQGTLCTCFPEHSPPLHPTLMFTLIGPL